MGRSQSIIFTCNYIQLTKLSAKWHHRLSITTTHPNAYSTVIYSCSRRGKHNPVPQASAENLQRRFTALLFGAVCCTVTSNWFVLLHLSHMFMILLSKLVGNRKTALKTNAKHKKIVGFYVCVCAKSPIVLLFRSWQLIFQLEGNVPAKAQTHTHTLEASLSVFMCIV